MGLLERVTTLIRANLNDLIDRAEDPEKMIKQVILDMRNQLIQVKTQVAMALADQHILEEKQQEHQQAAAGWLRKAEIAVDKGKEPLARQALGRQTTEAGLAETFAQQVEDQRQQVENLRAAFHQLQQKLAEAQSKADLLIAQHRRSRAASRAADAHSAFSDGATSANFDRMKDRVRREQALSRAKGEMLSVDSVEDQFERMNREEKIERLLAEIKQRKQLSA